MQGYIKDYRKEVESDVWIMPPLYHRTWQWLKYNVNHEENEIPMRDGTKLLIKRGQRLTSVRDLAKSIGWYEGTKWKEPNPKTVSVILEWMEKQGMISIDRGQGNRQYTLITIINWAVYNPKTDQGNSTVTPRTHLVDINNNDNNDFITTTTEPETVDDAHQKVFRTMFMNGLMSDYVRELKLKGYTDRFVIELMLETGESGNNPSLRLMKTIGDRWIKDGIYTRMEAKRRKGLQLVVGGHFENNRKPYQSRQESQTEKLMRDIQEGEPHE